MLFVARDAPRGLPPLLLCVPCFLGGNEIKSSNLDTRVFLGDYWSGSQRLSLRLTRKEKVVILIATIQMICSGQPTIRSTMLDTAMFVYEDRVNGISMRLHGDTVWSTKNGLTFRIADNGVRISVLRTDSTGLQATEYCIQGDKAVLISDAKSARVVPVKEIRRMREAVEAVRQTELKLRDISPPSNESRNRL